MKKNATKILACLLAVLMLLSCNPFFGTSFDFAAVNARAAHSDGEGGRADYSEFIGSSEIRSATPDQILTMILDYCDDALTYQGEIITEEFFKMTGDRYDFSSVDGVIRTGVKWIEDRRFGGDFDSLDISSVKGITRKDGDMKLLFSVFGFLVDNSKYISKLFNGEFDFGSVFTYFGLSESESAEVIDSIQSFDLLKLLISMFGSSAEGDTAAEGETTAASLDTLLADMVNGVLNGFLDEIYVNSYSAGDAINVDNIRKDFEGSDDGSSTDEGGTSDGNGDTSESGENEPEFIHSSLDISQDSLYTLIDKVIIGLFENFTFGFSGKKLDEFSVKESFAELCNYLINYGVGSITTDPDKLTSPIDISTGTFYDCVCSLIEALLSDNQQVISSFLDEIVQTMLWSFYKQTDVTSEIEQFDDSVSSVLNDALWKTDYDNWFDWQVIGNNGEYFLIKRVTDSHTENPDYEKGTRVYRLELMSPDEIYADSENGGIRSDIEFMGNFSAFAVPADSAEREAIADKLAGVTDGRVFVHIPKGENREVVKNYIYDSSEDVLYRCAALCYDITEAAKTSTDLSVTDVEENFVRLAGSARIFDVTAGISELNGTRKLLSFADETENYDSVEAVYTDESGKKIYLVCSDAEGKYVAEVTTQISTLYMEELVKIFSLLDPTVDLDVNDFGLAENYFTFGGLVPQLNHILCKLAEKLLLPDVYSAIGFVDGGNENLTDNLNSVIRFALTSDKTKVLANILLSSVTDDFAEMSEEEKAEITVSKIGVMVLNKYMSAVFPEDGSEFGWHKIESLPEGIAFLLSYLRAAVFGTETEKGDAYYDGCLADYRELLFAKGEDAEYWKNVNFTLLTDLLMSTFKNKVFENSEENMQLAKYPFVNEYLMQCKANGFTWRDYLDDFVDWLLYYAKGAFPAMDNVPTRIGVTDGNGAWYKLSKILQILPVTLINGCEKTYGDETVAFDLGVFIEDIIYGGVSDLDIGKILSFVSVNGSNENYFYDTPLFDAALRIFSDFVNGILPGAIGDDIIENIDIITNPATLFDLVDDIFTAVGNRNEHIQDVVLKIVCMILRIDGGSTEFSKQTSFDSFAQFAAYAVYSFVIPGSVNKDIVNPYDYTDKMFDSDGNILKKDDAYWKEQTFNMLVDSLVWMLIESDIGFGLTHEDIISYKNEGWTWFEILDETADWAIDYVDGLIPVTDTMSHERGRLDGNGPWYKISVILNSLLPTAILNGCGKTYGDETLVFDLGVFVDKIYSAACDLQLGNITEIFGRNDNELNPFSGRSLIAAALSVVQHLVNGLFPGTIEDDMLISIDNLLGRSNLARIAVNITKSINDRKQYLFPSIIELLQKLGLFDWLVPWLACEKHDYVVTKEKTIIGEAAACYRDVHKVVCQTCSYAIVDKDTTWRIHDFEITEYDDNGTILTKKTCKKCGLTHSDADCANGNHCWSSWTEIRPATCVVAGSQERFCPFCDETETSEISALGHDYSTEWTVDYEPTCTENGLKSHHCTRCIERTDETVIPAAEHTPDGGDATVVAPTCTELGYTERTCAVCGKKYNDTYVDALGHDWSDEWTVVGEATCTESGAKSHTCVRCGTTDTVSIPALGHDWADEKVTVNPTCTENGYTRKDCTRCDALKNIKWDEKYATSHPYENDCDTEYTFKYPGAEKIEFTFTAETMFERNYDFLYIYDAKGELVGKYSGDELSARKVVINGDGFTLRFTSDGSNAYYGFEIENITVSVSEAFDAEYTIIPAVGHTPDETAATVVAPTCTERGYTAQTCAVCGEKYNDTYVDALGHDFSTEWTIDREPTCTDEGLKSHRCTRCGMGSAYTSIPAAGHISDGGDVRVVAPTCTELGYTEHTCAVCGKKYNDTYVDALGHDWTDEKVTVNATCTENGYTRKDCTRCDALKNIKWDEKYATSHPYENDCDTEYTFKYPGAEKIEFTFTAETMFERNYDFLYIYDGKGELVGKYSDDELSARKVVINGDGFTLRFTSDVSSTYYGFEIENITVSVSEAFDAEYTVLPATGHEYGEFEVAKEPTCTVKGEKRKVCAKCGDIATEEIPALGHDWSDEWTVDKAPSCTGTGSKSHHCTRCDAKSNITSIACIGHAYGDFKVVKEPNCTVDGTKQKVCANCGDIVTEEIPALGHDYSTEWTVDVEETCTTDGSKSHHCSRCDGKADVTAIPAKGHAYGEFEVTKQSTCTSKGTQKKVCANCGDVVAEEIPALGHDYSAEWTVDVEETCTADGSKSHHCSRCDGKADVTAIPAKGHAYGEFEVTKQSTCTSKGSQKKVCANCGDVVTEEIPALGHDWSTEWTVDKAPTCTSDGSKSRHCSRCDGKTDILSLTAEGHAFAEKKTERAATCTETGLETRTCVTCGYVEKTVLDALGHNYGEYTVTKEATVLCEGEESAVCLRCGETDVKVIPKIQIDTDTNRNYGVANFTVVNAQTKEPIKGASLFISTEDDGENTFFTDENGKVSIVLPVGKLTVSAYAEGCLTRNLKVKIKPGTNDIPLIGLSSMKTYDAELSSHPMTKEEMEEAGIDTDAPENNHVFKYELQLTFVPGVDWLSIFYYMNGNGALLGGGGSGGSGGGSGSGSGYSVTWEEGTGEGHFRCRNENSGEVISIYPVSEYFVLIIRGEVRWLKEMFDVEMLVINNSETDTLENLEATLELPDGLSLAVMKGEQQTLCQNVENVPEGESKSVHWYVRGDKAGSYELSAKLTGTVMPFEEEINDVFKTKNALQVWAGNALHLDFEFPGSAYYGKDYPVKITLTNVSDITLYNVSHYITGIEQSRVTLYSDGSVEKEVYMDKSTNIGDFVPEFHPGDKIVIELSINILFKSKLMEHKLNKLIGVVDQAEQLVKSFKAIKSALDIADGLVSAVGKASKAVDSFISSATSDLTEKVQLARDLKEALVDYEMKYSKYENKTVDAAVKLANSSVGVSLKAFTQDPDTWLKNSSVKDIKKLIGSVKTLGNSISGQNTKAETKKFNVFDSIRTLISAIPIVFTLTDVMLFEDEDNTTSIPWSYTVTQSGPEYFGVTDLGRHLSNILVAGMSDLLKDALPSYIFLIPGASSALSAEDAKKEIAVVENEIARFKAKTASGDVKYKVYVERKTQTQTFAAYSANTLSDGFILSSDNKTAKVENGVLTFTGDGMIEVTPTDRSGGILVVEDSEGNRYEYDMTVVAQHDCTPGEREVIVPPTAEYDGFAVDCCSTCGDILNVELLSANGCSHTFGEWTEDVTATCIEYGLKHRDCSNCGYSESEITEPTEKHTPGEWIIDREPSCSAEGEKHTVCTVCGTVTETVAIAKKSHTMSDWSVKEDSTCTKEGISERKCAACEYTETKAIAKKAHTESEWITVTVATCTDAGKRVKKCTACETVLKSETVPATGHKVGDWTVKEDSTCTKEGISERKCAACEYTETKAIAKKAHTESEWITVTVATCTDAGKRVKKCTACGTVLKSETVAAHGHADADRNGKCDNCGEALATEKCSHICHSSNKLAQFFWKMLRLLYKMFKTHEFCDCGIKHW